MIVRLNRYLNAERVLLVAETPADMVQLALLAAPPYCWPADPSGEGVHVPHELSSSAIGAPIIARAIRDTHASAHAHFPVKVTQH